MKRIFITMALCLLGAVAMATPVEDFRNSWNYEALTHQRALEMGEPLGQTSFQFTHNSYNSVAYQNLGSYWDPNQQISVVDQLDIGIRALELDVHWAYGKLILCHGTSSHTGCSTFDRHFEDGIKEIATWLERAENQDQVILIYIEDHLDNAHDQAVDILEQHLGDRIYRPGSCRTLPMDITRAEMINDGKQVLLIGGDCSTSRWAETVFNYGFPTGNDSFAAYPVCTISGRTQQFVQTNLVRIFEDGTNLSATFGNPPPPITPQRMAEAMQCNIGIVGLDHLVPFDSRLAAAVWSWGENEPNNAGGNEHCAEQRADGRFNDIPCQQLRRAACLADTGEWAVTSTAVSWPQAEAACAAEFGSTYQFDVPRNGYSNQQLKEAREALSVSAVWLNYSDLANEGEWLPWDYPDVQPPEPPAVPVWRKLRNDHGRCLDLEDRSTADGTQIHHWSCHGADSQMWWQDPQGRLRAMTAPDKCADVSNSGTSEGTRIVLWPCHDGDNQRWERGASNSFRPAHAPHRALDIRNPLWGNGQRAHLWTFHGGKSQRWSWD